MREFLPPFALRNRHAQSLLASSKLRRQLLRLRYGDLARRTRELILDAGDGVRLQGMLTEGSGGREPVVVLHGWEGSHRSAYVVGCTHRLLDAGHPVLRLNLRDHGDTHHLNDGIFHSCRLDEVVGAVASFARLRETPVSLVGFSLGGNFALRIGLRAGEGGFVRRIVTVSPVLDPQRTMEEMERGPGIYEWYFSRKWRHSLACKQRAFPGRYDFSGWPRTRSLRAQTAFMLERFTDYASMTDYFDGYTLTGDRLAALPVETTIVSALDDPIIPADDFLRLTLPPRARLELLPLGGHNGFLDSWGLRGWVEDRARAALAA